MPFDAGSIMGSMGIDLSAYSKALAQSTAQADTAKEHLDEKLVENKIEADAAPIVAALQEAVAKSDEAKVAIDAATTGHVLDVDIHPLTDSLARAEEASRDIHQQIIEDLPPIPLDLDPEPIAAALQAVAAEAVEQHGQIKQTLEEPIKPTVEPAGIEQGLLRAQGLMQLFPAVVTDFMVDPLLGVAEAAKQAFSAISEMILGVGNNAAEMGLQAEKAGVSVKFLSELSAAAANVNISTQELGMGFKFMQRDTDEAIQSGLQGLGHQGDKIDELTKKQRDLNDAIADQKQKLAELGGKRDSEDTENSSDHSGQSADKLAARRQREAQQYNHQAEAINGVIGKRQEEIASIDQQIQKLKEQVPVGDQVLQAYNRLGISLEFLQANAGNSEVMFKAVKDGLDGIKDSSARVGIAQELLSRSGSNLLPIFLMQKTEMDKAIDTAHQLGAVYDDQSVAAGLAFLKLETTVSKAFEGIKMAAATPILQFLADHMAEITPEIISFSQSIRDGIAEAFGYFKSKDGKDFLGDLPSIIKSMTDIASGVAKAFGPSNIKEFVDDMSHVATALKDVTAILHEASVILGLIDDKSRDIANNGSSDTDGHGGVGGDYGVENDESYWQNPGVIGSLLQEFTAPGRGKYGGYDYSGGDDKSGSYNNLTNVNVNVAAPDPAATAEQIAKEIAPKLKEQMEKQHNQAAAQHLADKVKDGMGS